MKIDQYRGNCNYWFVPTIYKSFEKPTEKSITKEMILGSTIGSGYDKETTRKEQPGIEIIWDYVGGNPKFFFGFVIDAVEHKDLLKFKDSFEKVGSVNIIDGLKKTGSFGYSENFERFEERYDDLDKQISIFGYKKYPIKIGELPIKYLLVEEVKKHFGKMVFKTIIQRNIRLSEAPSFGEDIITYDASSRGAKSYLSLGSEILKRNK